MKTKDEISKATKNYKDDLRKLRIKYVAKLKKDGFTVREIMDILGISKSTVYSMLDAGKKSHI